MIRTAEGPFYLAAVLDPFFRQLLGYAMSGHHDTAVTTASVKMAVATRGGDVAGVIFHSDGKTVLAKVFPSGLTHTAIDRAGRCRGAGDVFAAS